MSGSLFIISAPSGAGKTSLIHAMLDELKSTYAIERAVTYTTKMPRAGEVDGKDYHFVSQEFFEQKIKEGFFLEWSTDYSAYYGTPVDIKKILEGGTSLILIIDRRGAQQILAQIPSARAIWIYTADLEELKRRLRGRGTEDEGQIAHRFEQAKIEIDLENKESLYHYHVLNDNFLKAAERLKEIIVDGLAQKDLQRESLQKQLQQL
jgi:guanylate kinase